MSAFRIGRGPDGYFLWWESHLSLDHWHTESRDALPEEVKLMERVVWHTDSQADRNELKSLMVRAAIVAAEQGV